MITTLRALVPAVAALSALAGGLAHATPPLSAYGRLPQVSNVEISPDGRRFAAIIGTETESEIQIRETGTNQVIARTRAQRSKVRSLQWAGPDHLLATITTTTIALGVSGGRREWAIMTDFSVQTRKWRAVLGSVDHAMNVVSGPPTTLLLDGKPTLIAPGISFPGSTGVSTLFRVSLDSGLTTMVEQGSVDTLDWVIGKDGKAIARVDYRQRTGEWTLLLRRKGLWQRSYVETAPVDYPSLLSMGRDSGSVLVSTRKSGDWQVHEVTVADGNWSAARPELDGDGSILDPATRTLLGTVDYGLDSVDYKFLMETDQKLWNSIKKAFPGGKVTLASWSDDRMTAIVEVEGGTHGDAFFLVDRKARTADYLANRYAGIASEDVGPVRAFRYKAADGMDIPAYLTLPPGSADARKLPLVVLVHGGPAARDYPGFDWWAQAIASRGYAVLQPQFRGSAGFGAAHRDAGFGEWGRKMQTDLSDGVRHLAGAGTIDPARVCIAGASYGGYAALAGVTLDAGVYRCASAVAGIADLRRMLMTESHEAGGSRNATLRYWRRFMGAASDGDPRLDAISPARLADRVKVPVQLIHGKDDTVVRFEQSVMMEKALRAAAAPVELVPLVGEDHWLSRGATRLQMLTAMTAFLEKHNPPGPAPAAGR